MSENTPKHVSIIPDGNRRWAKNRALKPWEGHAKSGTFENLNPLFEEAEKQGIKYLSFWGFSTENWKRDKKEVDIIMRLILKGLNEFEEHAAQKGIRFVHVGRKDRLLDKLVEKMGELEEGTKDNQGLCVVLCLDYGGRDEITRAINKVVEKGEELVGEEDFLEFLDTSDVPDPDLIIRTGGEKRLSGFMPYQSTYAELYFTDVYFPDFNPEELGRAVEEYKRRQRRFGS